MTLHIFANIVTPYGTAANNRGETDGNTTTLQKLVWRSAVHTTVSAESIRFALRSGFVEQGEKTNRYWDEVAHGNRWNDPEFKSWAGDPKGTFIDDDLLGYMRADAKKEEGTQGTATIRRAVLEITRAVSLTPWSGDVSFNAASPGATPSAAKSKSGANPHQNPVPYGTELHATRYQFGMAMTPSRLADKSRAAKALEAIGALRSVAGNHGRFLYDFSPEAIIIRITDDPAPRILYCFDTEDGGQTVSADDLLKRIESGDVLPEELLVGVSDLDSPLANSLKKKKIAVSGVRAAVSAACQQIRTKLK